MTKAQMTKHAARVRAICLSFPEAIEKLSHGEPTYFTPKRVFAMMSTNHHDDGHVAVLLPAAPGVQEALIEDMPKKFYYPKYVGGSGWIGVELHEIGDDELGAHIHEAHKFISAKDRPGARRRAPAKLKRES